MGDTGSLAIGAAFATLALTTDTQLLLPVLGGLFVLETLSVMIQVGWFKYTRRRYGEGRRLLLISPLHNHFRRKGWPETRIVTFLLLAAWAACRWRCALPRSRPPPC